MENQILPNTSIFNENTSLKKGLSSKNIKQKDISTTTTTSNTTTNSNSKTRSVFSDLSQNPKLKSSNQSSNKKKTKTKFKLYEDEEGEIEYFHKTNKIQKEPLVFSIKDEDGKLKETTFSIEENLDQLIKFPTTKFNTNQKRNLEFTIKKSEIIVPGSSGISNYEIKETLWGSSEVKCKNINSDKTWKKAKLDTISEWEDKNDEISIYLLKKLNVDPEKSPLNELWRGFRYFHLVNIYADKPGNISEDIFKDWSITKAQVQKFIDGDPVVFKTLNLVKLVKVLNDVANERFKPTLIASIALDFNLTK